jgi:hypothetical protein
VWPRILYANSHDHQCAKTSQWVPSINSTELVQAVADDTGVL